MFVNRLPPSAKGHRSTHVLRWVVWAVAVVALVPGGARRASAAVSTTDPQRPTGNFVSACAYSHSAPDDPIVHPGRPNATHRHDFFGSTSTDAFSTASSLSVAPSTCRREGDNAAYWTPSLIDGNQLVRPLRVVAYYQVAGRDPASIVPFPFGLKVVTDPLAGGVEWSCAGRDDDAPPQPDVPTCPVGTHLVMRVHFPDCWDGVNLDSVDHRSHLSNTSRGGACPGSHPVAVPHLRLNVHYPDGVGGADVGLSSGGPSTSHADFFNAWDPQAQRRLVQQCLNLAVSCGSSGPAAG
jgi:hypothetical protein